LWIPEDPESAGDWHRITSSTQPEFTLAPGVLGAAAVLVTMRPQADSFFGRVFGRRKSEERRCTLPNGEPAVLQQERADALLVWCEEGSPLLDQAWFKSRWPQMDGFRSIGPHIFLVHGVDMAAGKAGEGPGAVAERLLSEAQAAGDRRREVSALADLGSVYLHEGKAEQAIAILGQALRMAKELGDRSRESDILGTMGLVTLTAGQPGRALEIFTMELGLAREASDRYAEKIAQERMGLAHSQLNQPTQALDCFQQALTLARNVHHRKHEADLLWYLGIQYAELGQRDQALKHGQEAVALMEKMRNPQAAVFAEHLQKYRQGEAAQSLGGSQDLMSPGSPGAFLGGALEAGLLAGTGPSQGLAVPAEGPGLLRMALSAAKSLGKFVGSGFRFAAADTVRRRLETCAACEHHTGLRCRLCGCFTNAKARLDHEECPIGKWPG
jgi:tetratricopeptide (TPR) repeat protein